MSETDKQITRVNAEGVLEGLDPETGAVLWVEKKKRSSRDPARIKYTNADKKPSETHHHIIDDRGRKLWVPKGTNPDELPRVAFPFAQVTCDQILQKVTEGLAVTQIGQLEGFPPAHTIFRWLREHPEFRAHMRIARECRADFFEGKVIEVADTVDEDNVQASRVKVAAYQWVAQISNPDVYGNKTKVVGDPDRPITYIIDTGISRTPRTDDIEVQGVEIPE
ncbi:MAG TPA: hypothetical protein DCS07_05030 [Bdellovibrionales bacterium]|nr:MAG: hypothetical protein A2Z97_16145 [Bdellovibrionales bacterium GWB1_52_6]OFZ05051.1 MAG: hypothetical protein A2X97_00465 [Bdellovibrionales bacterium GWA1_52_35]OFZ37246.1 MAG: hypothetical protein A2070_07105 [Bdellovibrionales bacterium GWC1_52_8]HAR41984.1 hypothetical protein [Bdellovibrionales bacterium]HCM41287.1 hypothetical protein [Bdellovibrionales bacterium]